VIQTLSFAATSLKHGVREVRWIPKSTVTIPRACEIANELAKRLQASLGTHVEVYFHEPVSPSPPVAAALLAESELFEIDAEHGRAWIFLDAVAARRLVAAAFAEPTPAVPQPWSALERSVLKHILSDVAEVLHPLCGEVRRFEATSDHRSASRMTSLIALHLGAPFDLEIDVALAQDPPLRMDSTLSRLALNEVLLRLRALAGTIRITCAELSALEIGAVLPMSRIGQAQLVIDQTTIAHGVCGIIGRHLAFRIDHSHESQGA
jgi:flagellar motor switch protein FliM